MRQSFRGYYKPTGEEAELLWSQGTSLSTRTSSWRLTESQRSAESGFSIYSRRTATGFGYRIRRASNTRSIGSALLASSVVPTRIYRSE